MGREEVSKIQQRNKKVVDYSQFGDLEDDDEDFAPSSKKSRTQLKESKKEKKEKPKKPREVTPSQTLNKRLSLDDKLYKRDLEVALALSVKEKSTNPQEVKNPEEQGKTIESENTQRRSPFSNCSVDSELLGLNQVMDGDTPDGDGRQRTAADKVPIHHKSLVVDSDDRAHDLDSEPESVPTSPIVSPSWITEQNSEPRQKVMSSPSEAAGRPLHASSPVTDKKPKWTPPAPSGSSYVKCVPVKSPTHCLRLGLSRLARVKPLHPSATSTNGQ
ncbi:RAD51-associated protein 1 isoform X1 [Parus major]|uniref:RAD51-associated protein 1 isoform X1 n=1 Tax=Parus major TaxID=9157 RepID=UPI000771037B|nr:RAD51-associated protein 1 isoform X1 [Parus major]XP_015484374.1 RAD51-associated protein 1 isoform X1 [Parus major]XP_015484375.1 RAD51-associated protein 1 isoform X1 [Parus major]